MAVYKLSGNGKMIKMTKQELAAMKSDSIKNQRKLVGAIMDSYGIPHKNNQDIENFREILYQNMTKPSKNYQAGKGK